MKSIFLKSILAAVLAFSFAGTAGAQQTNMHLSIPPMLDSEYRNATGASASFIRMDGEGVDLSGLDMNATFRRAASPTEASDFTVGATLLGSLLGGEMELDTVKSDVSGTVLHATYNKEHLVVNKPSASLMLFWGLPVSFGHYVIEATAEDVTLYNLMAGVQGGARVVLKADNFMVSPLLMATFMGGYRERYNGGVYYENLDSGGVPIFAVAATGLELLYLPLRLSLKGTYQRTFKSGSNKPMNTAVINLALGF